MSQNISKFPFSMISVFLLVILFYLSFSPSTVVSAASPLDIPPEFVFASLLPMSHVDPIQRQIAREAKVILELAVKDVNAGAVQLPSPIRLVHTDAPTTESGLSLMWSLYHSEPNLHGYIGGFDNLLSTPQSLMSTVVDKLYFTCYGRAPYLADVSSFPTVIIQTCTSHALGLFAARQVLASRWYRFALLNTADDDALGFQTTLMHYINVTAVTEDGLTVDIYPYQIPDYSEANATTDVTSGSAAEKTDVDFDLPSIIDQTLDDIVAQGVWVVVVHGTQTPEVMYRAYHRGLLQPPYAFMIDSCTQVVEKFKNEPADALTGVVCIEVAEPGDEAEPFHSRLKATAPDVFTADFRLYYEHVAIYNSILAFAQSIKKSIDYNTTTNQPMGLTGPMTGSGLFNIITTMSEPGLLPTYPLIYQLDGEVRVDVGIYNYDPQTRGFVMKAAVDVKTGTTRTYGTYLWPDGTSNTPKDRPRVYVNGDVLFFTKNSNNVIIGFIAASLGAWTSLILLEQALAFRHRQGFVIRSVIWTVLSSIGLSIGCVWPIIFIQFNEYTVDYTSLAYSEVAIAPTAIFLFFVVLIAFLLCLYAVPKESATERKSATKANKRPRGADKSKIEQSVNHSQTPGSHNSKSENENDDESSQSSSTSSSASLSLMARLQRIRKHCDGDISNMAYAFSWHIAVAAFLIDMIIIVQWSTVLQNLTMTASYTYKVSSFVGAFFFMYVFIVLSLLIYFHATIGDIRPFAPFLIAGVVSAGCQIALIDGVFTLDISKSQATNALKADTYFTLVLIAVCVCITAVLMAINISALKISKTALDKVLEQLTSQILALERTMADEKERMDAIRQEGLFFRRTLECINLCRPVFRNHAVAIAMADPDIDGAKALLKEQEAAKKKNSALLNSSMAGVVTSPNQPKAPGVRPSVVKSHNTRANAEASTNGNPRLLTNQNNNDMGAGAPGGADQADPVSVSYHDARSVTGMAASVAGTSTAQTHSARTRKTGGRPTGAGAFGQANEHTSLNKLFRTGDIARLHCMKQDKQLLKLMSEIAVMDPANMNTPVQSAAIAAIKLPQLLSNPLTIELMKDVLNKQLSPENMAFWLDIQKYRSIENPLNRRIIGDEIYHLYICDGAKYEINLSSTMKEGISNKMNRAAGGGSPNPAAVASAVSEYSISLFDDAEKEIFKLMQTNNYETLASSPFFKLAAMVLEHNDYKLKNATSLNTVKMQQSIAIAKNNAAIAAAFQAKASGKDKDKDAKSGNDNSQTNAPVSALGNSNAGGASTTAPTNTHRRAHSVMTVSNTNHGANTRRNTNSVANLPSKDNNAGASILKGNIAKPVRAYPSFSRANSVTVAPLSMAAPIQMFTTVASNDTANQNASAANTRTAAKSVVKLNIDTSKANLIGSSSSVAAGHIMDEAKEETHHAPNSMADLPGVPAASISPTNAATATPTLSVANAGADLPQPPSGRNFPSNTIDRRNSMSSSNKHSVSK